jgi:gamma-glutamylcyclotransferase (GGCT)/AIG2-like uncharacterized protein YtfP
MALMFLNGGGMRGGPLHPRLQGAPLVREARTAARYRFYAVEGRFPALVPADPGFPVRGEVYDVPLAVLHDDLLPAEPPELELAVIRLDDGTACLGMVLRRPYQPTAELTDISELGGWRAYLERQHG